jgi:hypothetical protein
VQRRRARRRGQDGIREADRGADELVRGAVSAGSAHYLAFFALLIVLVESARAVRLIRAPHFGRHQATVFYCTSKRDTAEDARTASLLLVAGCLMVVLQCCTSMAVVIGTTMQSCSTNEQCPLDLKGQFCSDDSQRCFYCGFSPLETVEISPDGTAEVLRHWRGDEDYAEKRDFHNARQELPGWATLNDPEAKNFAGFNTTHVHEVCANPALDSRVFFITQGDRGRDGWTERTVVNWCDSCVHAETGSVNTLTQHAIGGLNVAAMGRFDWAALFFATFIVGLAIIGELVRNTKALDVLHDTSDKSTNCMVDRCVRAERH